MFIRREVVAMNAAKMKSRTKIAAKAIEDDKTKQRKIDAKNTLKKYKEDKEALHNEVKEKLFPQVKEIIYERSEKGFFEIDYIMAQGIHKNDQEVYRDKAIILSNLLRVQDYIVELDIKYIGNRAAVQHFDTYHFGMLIKWE